MWTTDGWPLFHFFWRGSFEISGVFFLFSYCITWAYNKALIATVTLVMWYICSWLRSWVPNRTTSNRKCDVERSTIWKKTNLPLLNTLKLFSWIIELAWISKSRKYDWCLFCWGLVSTHPRDHQAKWAVWSQLLHNFTAKPWKPRPKGIRAHYNHITKGFTYFL